MSLISRVSYSKEGWYCTSHTNQTIVYIKKKKFIQLLTKGGLVPSRHLYQHVPYYVHYLSNNHLYKRLQSHLQTNYQKQKFKHSFKDVGSLTKKSVCQQANPQKLPPKEPFKKLTMEAT